MPVSDDSSSAFDLICAEIERQLRGGELLMDAAQHPNYYSPCGISSIPSRGHLSSCMDRCFRPSKRPAHRCTDA